MEFKTKIYIKNFDGKVKAMGSRYLVKAMTLKYLLNVDDIIICDGYDMEVKRRVINITDDEVKYECELCA